DCGSKLRRIQKPVRIRVVDGVIVDVRVQIRLPTREQDRISCGPPSRIRVVVPRPEPYTGPDAAIVAKARFPRRVPHVASRAHPTHCTPRRSKPLNAVFRNARARPDATPSVTRSAHG